MTLLGSLVASACVCVALLPSAAIAQIKSIVIGEGVRGAMYLPAYIQ
jgi:hypothetical protein